MGHARRGTPGAARPARHASRLIQTERPARHARRVMHRVSSRRSARRGTPGGALDRARVGTTSVWVAGRASERSGATPACLSRQTTACTECMEPRRVGGGVNCEQGIVA